MTTLQFADIHNLVAFLAKPAESEGFEQVVDFMNASSIRYALTVNPTIYTSCIEQFWSTVKAKTINGEHQLQALVDRKKIIITEATLTLMGYEKLSQKLTFCKAFSSPQWKFLIHTILQCLSARTTAWNEFSSTMASAIICLARNQKFNFSKYIFESMVKNLYSAGKFLMYPRFVQVFLVNQLEGKINHNRIYIAPSHIKKVFANMKRQGKDFSGRVTPFVHVENIADEAVYKERDDSLERATTTATGLDAKQDKGGGPMRQDTIGDTITLTRSENVSKFSNDPLLAGSEKESQEAREKEKSRTHGLKRLYKVGLSARIDSSDDEAKNVHDVDMFGVHDLDGDEVFVETKEPMVNAATSTIPGSIAKDLIDVDMTLDQALAELKSTKPKAITTTATTTTTAVTRPKAKGLVIQEHEQASTPITSSKDKGKGIMVEEPLKMKKKD
ncbi:hypothetical protein Tco_1270482 [Tanacetum coccineum]